MSRWIWIGSACFSVAAHVVALAALSSEPKPPRVERIEMELAEVPRPPPPVPQPEPPPPPERVVAKRVVKSPPPPAPRAPEPKQEEPPPAPPKVGVDESQLSPEGGMAVATGVTLDGAIGTGTGTVATKAKEGIPGGRGRGRARHVPIFAVTRLPKAKAVVEPEVPESWRSRARDIVVVLELDIDAKGRVEEVRVIRGAGADLDRAVVRAAEETEFEPALVGADPVPVRYRIPYRIRVRG